MKRSSLALAAMLAAISCAYAQNNVTTPSGANINKTYDASNVIFAPTSCHVTVTTTAQTLFALMSAASVQSDGCYTAATMPTWPAAAYVKVLNSNLPAFCYSQEATLTSACLRGQQVPGWTDYPVPAAGLGATYFVVPSGTATMIVEWRG